MDNMATAAQSSVADRKRVDGEPSTRPVLWGMFGGLECARWLGFRRTLIVKPPFSNKTSVKQSQQMSLT